MARAAVAAPSEPETGTAHSLTRHPPGPALDQPPAGDGPPRDPAG